MATGRRHLAGVVVADLGRRGLQRGAHAGIDLLEGGRHLFRRHPQVVEADAVQALGVVPHGIVTPFGDVGQDRPDRLDGLVTAQRRSRQVRGRIGGTSAVEPGQERAEDGGHRRLTVPAASRGIGLLSATLASVTPHHAQLASTASSLDDLIARVTAAADELSGGQDDDVAADLYEVERSLKSGARRLASVLRRLGTDGSRR